MLVPLIALLLLQKPADPQAAGIKALEEQRFADAVQVFERATTADPNDYAAHFNLGFAYTYLNRDADAINEYRKTLELKPGLYQAELNLGQVLLRDRQPAEALKHLEAALKQKPDQFRPNFYAGEAAFAAGNPDKAEEYYKHAAALDAKNAGAQAGLGQIAMKRGNLEEANTYFRHAAEMDGSYRSTLLELAAAYEAKGDKLAAAAIYKEFPDNFGARERLGSIFFETGDTRRAVTELEAAVDKSPSSANRYALAMAYVKNKDLAKAEPLLAKAVQDEPQNTELRMSFGRLLRDEKKYNIAAMQFSRVTQAKPDSVEAWSELAAMLVLLNQDTQALAALDKLRALGAEKPGNFFIRAVVLDRNKQRESALESYEKFLATDEARSPDEDFQARQRVRILKKELSRK